MHVHYLLLLSPSPNNGFYHVHQLLMICGFKSNRIKQIWCVWIVGRLIKWRLILACLQALTFWLGKATTAILYPLPIVPFLDHSAIHLSKTRFAKLKVLFLIPNFSSDIWGFHSLPFLLLRHKKSVEHNCHILTWRTELSTWSCLRIVFLLSPLALACNTFLNETAGFLLLSFASVFVFVEYAFGPGQHSLS